VPSACRIPGRGAREPNSLGRDGRYRAAGEDKAWLEETLGANCAVIAGRGTYEAAGRWGGKYPWGILFLIVTHRPAEQPPGRDVVFAGSLARRSTSPTIIIAPVSFGAGKFLSGGFGDSAELEHLGVRQWPFATFIGYRVKKVKVGS